MSCEYCQGNYADPFNYDYAPLWFAWFPVKTSKGTVFMRKVHRRTEAGGFGNLAGTYPVTWYEYLEHNATKGEI